jgi:hypothetical protein
LSWYHIATIEAPIAPLILITCGAGYVPDKSPEAGPIGVEPAPIIILGSDK